MSNTIVTLILLLFHYYDIATTNIYISGQKITCNHYRYVNLSLLKINLLT